MVSLIRLTIDEYLSDMHNNWSVSQLGSVLYVYTKFYIRKADSSNFSIYLNHNMIEIHNTALQPGLLRQSYFSDNDILSKISEIITTVESHWELNDSVLGVYI